MVPCAFDRPRRDDRAPTLLIRWWAEYREELKRRFRQEELVIRATIIELL
jgi:hypothetical protein